MVRVTIVGGAGRVGRAIVEELGIQGIHQIILWTRRGESEVTIPNVKVIQVIDYKHENLVNNLQGTHTVLAFFNPMTDPGSRNQIALIDACVSANVKRFAPSEWAGKVRSGIKMYDMKEPVLDYLEKINQNEMVLEYGLFQPGLLSDYLAHPCPPSKQFNTFPLFFDLATSQAIVVEDGSASVVFTAAADVAKVVARAIDYPEPWTMEGGMVGERTSYKQVIETAEKITGKKFTLHHLKAEDLENGKWNSSWIPSYAENLTPEQIQNQLIPFLSGWALGIHKGVANMDPVWNRRFSDLKFTTVEEMLRGAWERIQAMEKVRP